MQEHTHEVYFNFPLLCCVKREKGDVSLGYAPVTFADTLVPCVHDPRAPGDSLPAPGFGLAVGTGGSSKCRRAFPTGYDAPPTRGSGFAIVCDGP